MLHGRRSEAGKTRQYLLVCGIDQLGTVLEVQQIDFPSQLRAYGDNPQTVSDVPQLRGIATIDRDGEASHDHIRPSARWLLAAFRAGAFNQVNHRGAKLLGFEEWNIVRDASVNVRPALYLNGGKKSRQAHGRDDRFNDVALITPVDRRSRFDVGHDDG